MGFWFALLLSASLSFAAAPAQSPRFVVNLLDYVAADYSGAVADGKILSQSEYNEQLEFIAAATKAVAEIPELKNSPEIVQGLATLKSQVEAKASTADVSKTAQDTKLKVIRVAKVEVAPEAWPDLKSGQHLFAERCTSCHGEKGFGDGPAGKGLEPQPANFHREEMAGSSPFKSFNVIRVGVPGTAMAPFHDLSDKEVWDLAFFVNSLRFESSKDKRAVAALTLEQVASKSDRELMPLLSGNDEEKKATLASLRTRSKEQSGNSLDIARRELEHSRSLYAEGKVDEAKTAALAAYLEGIEPVEPSLRGKDASFVTTLEGKMADVRSAIDRQQSREDVAASVQAALANVEQADTILAQGSSESPTLTLTLAAGILLREGFEAVLIIIALLAVIRAAGDTRAARWVHGGWIAAVGVGIIAWFFSGWLMGMSGIGREAMEGTISVLAVVVLLYVGFWLHRRTEIQRWKQFIEGHVKQLMEGGNLFGLAAIAFMAVFREAFECVLFLRAIWIDADVAGRNAMWIGVLIAFGMVIGLAWALIKWSAKLPLRKVFTFSSAMIIALAIILAGKGIHAFQETGLVPMTRLGSAHVSVDLIGLYNTLETLAAQIVTAIVSAIAWVQGNKPSTQGTSTDPRSPVLR